LAVIGAVAALAIGAFAWIYGGDLTYYEGPPIRSDGIGWYAYLPAVFLDHDVTMRRTADRSFSGSVEGISGVELVRTTSGKMLPLDPHGVGEAILMAPFFGIGHLLAVATNEPRDGFSWPYQAAAAASGLIYFLLGLAVLGSVLRRWFSRRTVVVTLLAIAFGAGVFHYATYDASYSHVYSFFLIALIMRLTLSVWDRPRVSAAAALGASIGLLGAIRPTNLAVILFCALVGVERLGDIRTRARALLRHFDVVSIGAGAFILGVLPQLAYLYRITGKAFVNQYAAVIPPAHLDLTDPHLVGVLFSVRKGLFFWWPLLVLAVIGLPFLRRTARPLFIAAVAYLAVAIWVASSWSHWWYDGSFGMRALIDVMPVFALGLAALIEVARGAVTRKALAVAIVVTSLLAVHGMVTYWLKAIPYDQTTWHQYLDSFVHYGAHTWHLND
jgi:hypothetical protein